MFKFNNWSVLSVLALVAAATTALSLFIKVAEEVVEGDTHQIDLLILMWLRAAGNANDPLGHEWLGDFARDITALGSPAVLGLIVLISSIFLLLAGNRRLSIFMIVAAGGGTLVATVLKQSIVESI